MEFNNKTGIIQYEYFDEDTSECESVRNSEDETDDEFFDCEECVILDNKTYHYEKSKDGTYWLLLYDAD